MVEIAADSLPLQVVFEYFSSMHNTSLSLDEAAMSGAKSIEERIFAGVSQLQSLLLQIESLPDQLADTTSTALQRERRDALKAVRLFICACTRNFFDL
jgi:hypothetical protein